MSSQPFDLTKLDYKAIRRQERRKLILRSAIPVALVFVVALWFLLPTLLTHKAIGHYNHDRNSTARRWLTPLTWSSPEQFVIAFNSGTVDTKLGKYDLAEKELTRAVSIAPEDKRCMAAQNLVASLKAHAESIRANNAKEATVLDTKAATVIKANQDCFKGAAGGGGGGASNDAAAQSQAPTDAQQQQLQQKEQEGRDRKAQFARDETFNPNDPKIKPW